ncbi:hypothetical protein EDF56_106421 [Novosphingobium sp. PhB165]|uniref:hypothetical protein n=1 Tax=Novosphingobium sp. PhB165 TaxID=2485105 RepID=UPI00104FD6BB|nr:hypothetical protein [Novosphingobium sp. PhB165]TCM17304.1 hypothetical protein EDF56_106421 [Novosphingobium sp. PhB165]
MPPADSPTASPPAVEQSLGAFDLARLRGDDGNAITLVRKRCPEGKPGEIVVCAPDPEANRLRALPDTYQVTEGLGRAERQIAPGVVADVHMDSVTMPGGVVSNRVMAGVKIAF